MTEDLNEKVLRIEHWGPTERAITFRYNSEDTLVYGEIIGMMVKPDQKFEAEILVKAGNITYQGTVYCGWCEEGDKPRQYRFIKEPEEVTQLKEQFKRKRREAVLERIRQEEEEGKEEDENDDFLGDLDAAKERATVDRGRKGSGRVSAVKKSRLSEDTGGEG